MKWVETKLDWDTSQFTKSRTMTTTTASFRVFYQFNGGLIKQLLVNYDPGLLGSKRSTISLTIVSEAPSMVNMELTNFKM